MRGDVHDAAVSVQNGPLPEVCIHDVVRFVSVADKAEGFDILPMALGCEQGGIGYDLGVGEGECVIEEEEETLADRMTCLCTRNAVFPRETVENRAESFERQGREGVRHGHVGGAEEEVKIELDEWNWHSCPAL